MAINFGRSTIAKYKNVPTIQILLLVVLGYNDLVFTLRSSKKNSNASSIVLIMIEYNL